MSATTPELFQYISDVHIENCRDYPRLAPTAQYLFLVGDIGHISSPVWREFIKYLHEQTVDCSSDGAGWYHIFYVLGNHEYYSNSKTMPILLKAYHEYLAEFPGITLLDRNEAIIIQPDDTEFSERGKLAVLGATMWPQAEFSLVSQINDFRRINIKSDPANPTSRTITMTPMEMNELHLADREWLFEKLSALLTNNPDIQQIIILSHFPLTRDGTSDPQYSGQKQAIKNYYANDYHAKLIAVAMELFGDKTDKKIISISGHTHYKYDFVRDGVRYVNSGAWGFHLPPSMVF
jgi:predicted phosphodiesterase